MRASEIPFTFIVDLALRAGLVYWLSGKLSDKIRNWFGDVPGLTDLSVSGKAGLSLVLGVQTWMLSPNFLRFDSTNPIAPFASSALSSATSILPKLENPVSFSIWPSSVSFGNAVSFAGSCLSASAHGALSAVDYAVQTGPAKFVGQGAGTVISAVASTAYNNMFALGILGFEAYWIFSIMETKKQLDGLRIQSNLPYMAAACCVVPMATACVAPSLITAGVSAACFIPTFILDQAAQDKINAHHMV